MDLADLQQFKRNYILASASLFSYFMFFPVLIILTGRQSAMAALINRHYY